MPTPRFRTALILVVLVAAAAGLWWLQQQSPVPGTASPDAAVTDTPAVTGTPPLATGTTTEVAAPDSARSTPAAPQRAPAAARWVARGTFTAPQGPWPGDGEVQLIEVVDQPEGGVLGFATVGMDMARLKQRQHGQGPEAERAKAEADKLEKQLTSLMGRGLPVLSEPVQSDGSFEIADPPGGRFVVQLHHPRLIHADRVEIEVVSGRDTDAGVIATMAAGSLRVLAHDSDGRPVPNAQLELHRNVEMPVMNPAAAEDMLGFIRKMIPLDGKTDERGTHLFVGLEPADWNLSVSSTDLVDVRRPVRVLAGRENLVQVELSSGAELNVSITGDDGLPVPQARLHVEFPDIEVPTRGGFGGDTSKLTKRLAAGPTGDITVRGLPAGRAIVQARVPGYVREDREVALSLEEVCHVSIRLQRGVTIAGTVIDDTGAPIATARVMRLADGMKSVMGMDFSDFFADVQSLQAHEDGVATDADGRFVLGGLRAGETTSLLATAPGFDHSELRDVAAGTSAAEIRLARNVQLAGRVLDADGEPLTRFEVRLEKRSFMIFDQAVRTRTYDNTEDGRFLLDDLPRESLRLVVRAEGWADWSDAVDLREGAVDAGDIRLVRPASLAGVVVDADSQPIAGAKVRVAGGGPIDALMMAKMTGAAIVESDAQGRFLLADLDGSRVRLIADKEGYAPLKSKVFELVPGGRVGDVVLQLDRGGSLHGRLVDGDGRPIAGWYVQAAHTSGLSLLFGNTDANGEFLFEGLAPGPHKVDCMSVEAMAGPGRRAQGNPDDINIGKMMAEIMENTVSERAIVRNDERTELELTFDGAGADADASSIAGTVRLAGKPLDTGVAFLLDAESGAQVRVSEVHAGAFTMRNVREGRYSVRVQESVLGTMLGSNQPVTVTTKSRTSIAIDLPGGRLAGRVVDGGSGEPVAGVIVSLTGTGSGSRDRMDIGEGAALTDGSGSFHFDGVAPGQYEIVAKELFARGDSGRSARLAGLSLGADERRDDCELRLASGGTLRVAVRDASGPRNNALVALLTAAGQPLDLFHRTLTDHQGIATFAQLPAGDYRASVDAPGTAPRVSDAIHVDTGSEHTLDVAVSRGTPVTVVVEGTSLRQVAGKSLSFSLRDPRGTLLRSSRLWVPATVEGKYELSLGSYAPGTYSARIEGAGLGVWETEQTVPATGTARWTLR